MSSFVSKLRTAILSKQEIKLDPEDAVISEAKSVILNHNEKFPLDAKSGFKAESAENDIRTVYFCWLNNEATVTDYIEKCETFKIPVISFMARTELSSYLKGDTDTCSYFVNLNGDVHNGASETSGAGTVSSGAVAVNAGAGTSDAVGAEEHARASEDDGKKTGESETAKQHEHKVESGKNTKESERVRQREKQKRSEEIEKVDYKESKRRKLEEDPLLKCISIHEVELIDHDKELRGTQKSNDFSNLIRECEYKIVRPLKASFKGKGSSAASAVTASASASSGAAKSSGVSGSSGTKSSSASVSKSRSKKLSSSLASSSSAHSLGTILQKKDPIIILSPSAISMITMANVKSFLQNGRFVDVHDPNFAGNGPSTGETNMVQLVRHSKRFNKDIKFVVVSNVEKFFVKPEYWDRVVAVFTTGQEWQFKNYKVNQPNLLFQKVKGFYVNYSGDSVPNNVKNWNVQVISLDRNQRFKDRQISEFLWETIERFMLSRGYK
ncbi:hypothetical protein PMKS-000902 [Pichia membranifaciens]|uniref:Cell division control protein 73 C-terminal domain-containing protein n=1 Tax=Pichia membranifaciens TaxID=4926 RepID=A0A1Q2YD20_9ASCO|nr:hypothetical protein PMKS-000902 [Pichia membranifaciens]